MNQISPEVRRRRRSLRAFARRLLPADRRLFSLLDQQAALVVDAADALVALLADPNDGQGRVRAIEELEKRGDRVQREVMEQIGAAWLPPFPRPLVHGYVNRMDDVLDVIEDAAQSLHLYHATRITPEAIKLAVLTADCARLLQTAVAGLAQPGAGSEVARRAFDVAELESQADHVMRAAMSRLFREEPDARQIIKLKAVYEVLESLTDQCKHAANALQAIALRT